MADYGFNFNCAATIKENGECSVGVHVTDSEGVDIDRHAEGTNVSNVVSTLCFGVLKEMNSDSEKKAEQKAARRKELESQIDELNQKIAELDNEIKGLETPQPKPRKAGLSDRDLRYLLKIFDF